MKVKELIKLSEKLGDDYVQIEIFESMKPLKLGKSNFHTDNIESIDDPGSAAKMIEIYGDFEVVDFAFMNEEEYGQTVLSNTCAEVDFEEWYGDKNAVILCILLRNGFRTNGMVEKYLVVDSMRDGTGDEYITVFDDIYDANASAQYMWENLTPQEQGKRHIVVAFVNNSEWFLSQEAFDDDKIDYTRFHSYDVPDYAFDRLRFNEESINGEE